MRDRDTTVDREGRAPPDDPTTGSADEPADVSVDPPTGEPLIREALATGPVGGDSIEPGATGTGLRTRLRSRAHALFSGRAFLLATVAPLAGFLVVGGALPLGALGGLLGIATGGFFAGALAEERRYAETAAAGGAVGGVAAILDHLVLTVVGLGVPLVALGVVGGLVAGLIGHYLGRDLRDGLTREL